MPHFYFGRLKYMLPVAIVNLGLIASSKVSAQTCKSPDSVTLARVEHYITRRFHLADDRVPRLTESSLVNDGCFWKLRFSVEKPHDEITLYLSPDQQFLTPALFDIGVDPTIEESQQRKKVMKTLESGDPPTLGATDSRVTIVEFSDYECIYCRQFEMMMQKEVLPNEPNVRFVVRNFPLEIHPWAQNAAVSAMCVYQQDKNAFWKVRNYIYGRQDVLNSSNVRDNISSFVKGLKEIDLGRFIRCQSESETLGKIAADVQLGNANGVSATPTFFVNGMKASGVPTAQQMQTMIRTASSDVAAPPHPRDAKSPLSPRLTDVLGPTNQ